jgi:hypothetical protein
MTPGYSTEGGFLGQNVKFTRLLRRFLVTYVVRLQACKCCEIVQQVKLPVCILTVCYVSLCLLQKGDFPYFGCGTWVTGARVFCFLLCCCPKSMDLNNVFIFLLSISNFLPLITHLKMHCKHFFVEEQVNVGCFYSATLLLHWCFDMHILYEVTVIIKLIVILVAAHSYPFLRWDI